jgi:putative NADH-flavin reductase
MNREDVERVIKQGEVVLCALGHSNGSDKEVLSVATRYIITSMYQFGKRRLICLTHTAVQFPDDHASLGRRFAKGIFQTFRNSLYQDSVEQATAIKKSSLDWTLVRAPRLTDGPHTGHYEIGTINSPGSHISRANVAGFMLKQVKDHKMYKEALVVSD